MKLESTITAENINQNLLNVRYAVRGPIVDRATQIERELAKGVPKPFPRVVRANIGDCHALGQRPFTFIRQVLALVSCPQMLSLADIPTDVKSRVQELLADCIHSSVGGYSPPLGLRTVRERAASYMRARDGVPAAADDVCVGAGASDVIKSVLTMLAGEVDGKMPAVMIPIPQYPLFSGTLAELGIKPAEYYLDEANNWALSIEELERSWLEASQTHTVRALVVINPGNPTGQVMHEMGAPYSSMELASFLTCSKGWAAECGLRSGYVELLRLQPRVKAAFVAARGVMQCPTVLGQCVLDCVMKPPTLGEPSYPQFSRELAEVRRTLAERTKTAYRTFNSIPGYSCNPIDGAMFAFPRIELPARAQAVAHEKNMTPDEFYCYRLLEETGVCVVPGTGFGQIPDTFHFRTTILHPREEFQHMMDSIRNFHHKFLQEYA